MKKKPRNILHYTQNSIIRWHLLLLEELSLNDKKIAHFAFGTQSTRDYCKNFLLLLVIKN